MIKKYIVNNDKEFDESCDGKTIINIQWYIGKFYTRTHFRIFLKIC